MKKLLFALALLLSVFAWSQDRPIRADVVFLDTLTTTEIGNLTTRPSQGALVFNSTVDSVQVWNGTKWSSLGSGGGGETYTFSTGLTNTSGTITVTNPFEQTDEDKLDGIPAGATVGADWNTNLTNIPADIADGDDDTIADGSETKLSAGTNVTITGTGTTGSPYVINSAGGGTADNLGNHTATQSLDMADNNIVDVGTINATNADLATIETSGITSVGDVTIDGANLIVGGYGSFNSFILNPTDTEPTLGSRRVYWDLSENRLKGYNGSNWVGFALQSDLATAGTDDQTASEVTITDSGGNFTATDVEGALAELAASGGSGLSASDLGTTSKTLTQSDFNKFNYSESNLYLKVNNSITTDSRAAFQPLNINSFMVVTPDTGIAFVGNTVPPTGFYVDSLNIGGLFKLASNLYSVNGYVKPYSISQVTGLESSSIAETTYTISWDAATASVGTISDYELSIDGGTPIYVTGATSYDVTGATASTTYNHNVRAVDLGGNRGPYSADLEVTTSGGTTGDAMLTRFGSDVLLLLTDYNIDPDATTDGTAISGANIWEDESGNGYDATVGGGTFALNIGSDSGRQIEWTSSAWLDLPDVPGLEYDGTTPLTLIWRIGDTSAPSASGYAINKSATNRYGVYFTSAGNYGAWAGTSSYPVSPSTAPANSLGVLVLNGSTATMYVDGVQVMNTSYTSGSTTGQSWNIGGRTDGSYTAASGFTMDYVVILDRAVDASDLTFIEGLLQKN